MNKLTERFFQSPAGVFTQPEVAVALDGSAFSRHGLVKRALAHREILNIRRGLYCLAPRYQKKPVSVYALAQRVYGPSYVSLETALRYHGWIPEAVFACTCASYGNAKEFNTPLGIFCYRRIPQRIFYAGVERCIDPDGNVFFMASPVKALADYVYVHRLNRTSVDEISANLRIELEDLHGVAPEQIDMLSENYSNRRVKHFLKCWIEALIQ